MIALCANDVLVYGEDGGIVTGLTGVIWWGFEDLFHAKGWSITAWLSAGQHVGRCRIMVRSFEGSGGSSSELLFAPFAFPHPEKKKQSWH